MKKVIGIAVVVILIAAVGFFIWNQTGGSSRPNEAAREQQQEGKPEPKKIDFSQAGELLDDGIYSEHAILVNWSDRTIVASKEMDGKTWPASLTKIMTVLLAVEHAEEITGAGLDTKVVVEKADFAGLAEKHAAVAGFEPGEEVTVRDLVYGAMMPSGADAAAVLARWTSGSKQDFVERMNQRAAELGMTQTHFVTVDGLHDPEHYTTVADLARLMEAALQNDTFREIFTAKKYTTSDTVVHPQGMNYHSAVYKGLPEYEGGTLFGGKSGFTDEAGQCLISLVRRNSDRAEFFLITTGAYGDRRTEPQKYWDAKYLYERFAGDV